MEATNVNRALKDRQNGHMQVALQHALLIQRQKDVQEKILNLIEEFTELPAANKSTAGEARSFSVRVGRFRPVDYDDLIEERVSQGKCGYTLCARQPRTSRGHRSKALQSERAGNWCSRECEARSKCIESQLNRTPAWERASDHIEPVILLEETQVQVDASAKSGRGEMAQSAADLAFERGEAASSHRPALVMHSDVVERSLEDAMPLAPCLVKTWAFDHVEGYAPHNAAIETDE